MKKFKGAAGELESVIAILLSILFLCISLNVLSYIWTYQKISAATADIADTCAVFGDTDNGIVKDKINECIKNYGLNPEDVKISFSNTEYSEGSKVDYGNKITVSLTTNKTAVGTKGMATIVEISATKSRNSVYF